GKEDHVSMGMTAALKLRTIVANAESLLAIELLAAAVALDFRRPLKSGAGVERAYKKLRTLVPPFEDDRAMYLEIEQVADAIRAGEFDSEMGQL
ncbi:MAG: aromatic amino acid lyase, partial [Verrucomicrobiota bacterium]|nr:aromatic amino acid lyase [Verrucomicrobiota bacterium]